MSHEVLERLVEEVVALRRRVAALEVQERGLAACLAYRNTEISVPNATGTIVGLDAEAFDFGNLHDNVVNNSRLTAPRAGLYVVAANVHWANNATGERGLFILRNGGEPAPIVRARQGAHGLDGQFVGAVLRLQAGDYVEMVVYQTSGGPLGFEFTNGGAWLALVQLV